ncbi:MAG TPA: ABC-type transport auxiliary lipoprotein family protein [Syntrophorhabdaceae bacterium]|nr:ABC-type transport auxiliary lipoprotein family protein [Syntrophorhabdaceae bacterium]
MKRHTRKLSSNVCLFLIIALSFTGCLGRTKVPYSVDRYTLDYERPVIGGLTSVNEFIRVDRFSVAQSFNSTAMVYKPSQYRFDQYPYGLWIVNPGDLVSDLLIRDLRDCGLFKGVLRYDADEPVRYVLQGSIEDFYEADEAASSHAVLHVSIMIVDKGGKQGHDEPIFQKTYRFEAPLPGRSPGDLAGGLSSAMALFSGGLIKDLNSFFKAP